MSVTIRIDVFHCHDFDPAQFPSVDKAHSVHQENPPELFIHKLELIMIHPTNFAHLSIT